MTPSEFPTFKTERLLLRQFINADLENVFKGLSHPEVIKYYGVSYQTLEHTKKQMEFFADLEKNGTGTWWAVCTADNKIFMGACGLNNLNQQLGKAEIGFWLFPEYWGKGILSEALPLICNFGFVKLGLQRIEGFVETENIKSKKVMERLGFLSEGTMTDFEFKDGKFISLEVYTKFQHV